MAEPTSNTVGTRELKARLSEYVSAVEHRGEHVKVTRNGRLAAVLVPVDWYVSARVEQHLDANQVEEEERVRAERDRRYEAEQRRTSGT